MNKGLYFHYNPIRLTVIIFMPISLVCRNDQKGFLLNLLDLILKQSAKLVVAFERKKGVFISYFDIHNFRFGHYKFKDDLLPLM